MGLDLVLYVCTYVVDCNFHHLVYNSTNGLGMYVCVYPSIHESLLLLNALTDPNQIFCEGPNTQWLEIDGGGGRSPTVGAAKLPHRRTGEAHPQGAAKPPTKGRQAQPARWGSEAAPS